MPAPWGPHPPDHDAVVAERERRADEREMPVVPKEECVVVVAERKAVVEREIVMDVAPAACRVTAAPMTAVHRQRASRRGAQDCKCSRRDDELAEHRVPPSGIPLRIDSRDTAQECSIAASPELRRAFSGG